MTSKTTASFRTALAALPQEIREQARDAYDLFKQNPFHPSLRFRQVHPTEPIFSVRVTRNYRAVCLRDGDTVIWFFGSVTMQTMSDCSPSSRRP